MFDMTRSYHQIKAHFGEDYENKKATVCDELGNNIGCDYYAEKTGNRCAVGVLLCKEAALAINGQGNVSVTGVWDIVSDELEIDVYDWYARSFLANVQSVHDFSRTQKEFDARLRAVGVAYGIENFEQLKPDEADEMPTV